MNLLEKLVTAVSPNYALHRARARMAIQLLEQQERKYNGAQGGRRGREWRGVSSTSANTELQSAATILRDRSRDLGRNNPYARKAFKAIANNTVGTGIQPGIRATKATASNKSATEKLREAWRMWADSTDCDVEGLKTFWTIQHMVMRAVVESGECFVILRANKDTPGVPLRLQVLESDYLDTSRDLPAESRKDGVYILQGIEFNKDGSRRGYWLWDNHPGESRTMRGVTSNFYPAKNVLHIFDQERPGQIRGVPFLASVMQRLHDFDEYEDTQLLRQKIAACFVAFVEEPGEPTPSQKDADGNSIERVEPGIIERLTPGQKITFGSPPGVENYEEYSTALLRGVAAGAGVSFEVLTGNLSQVNFSSARMGWIEFQRQIEAWQWNMLIPQLCMKVWDAWLEAARVKFSNPNLTASVTWTAPRREMIDPEKETRGLVQRLNGYLASWEDIAREVGEDADELFDRIVADKKRFEAAGLVSPTDVRLNSPPVNESDATGTTTQKPE
jgi:lambda family phage portal protein